MASRLNFMPLWRGHWRGLTMRHWTAGGELVARPDRLARALTISVPLLAAVGCLYWLRATGPAWHLPADYAAVSISGAALLSAGLVAAFALLATWRDRLSSRQRARERPLRALVDEAVAHLLVAVLESILVVATTIGSLVLAGMAARIAAAATFGLSAHVLFVFCLLVPRLYSAYIQTNDDVDEHMDGFTRV